MEIGQRLVINQVWPGWQWVAAQFGGTHAEQLSHLLDATENSDKEDPTPFSHYTDLFIHIFRKFS